MIKIQKNLVTILSIFFLILIIGIGLVALSSHKILADTATPASCGAANSNLLGTYTLLNTANDGTKTNWIMSITSQNPQANSFGGYITPFQNINIVTTSLSFPFEGNYGTPD